MYRNKDKKVWKRYFLGFCFLLPAFVMISFTSLIPTIWNIYISFHKWNGMGTKNFIGIKNYIDALNIRSSKHAMFNSIEIALVAIITSMVIGLIMSFLIYRVSKAEGAFFRFVFYSPTMLPMTVVGLLFTFVFAADDGIFNNLLRIVGLEELTKAWLSTKGLVTVCIGIVQGWRFSGTVMMLTFTALLGLPSELYEDAKLSGATYWQQVRLIMLPMIRPTIVLTLSMISMWAFKTYDIVAAMTGGGPGDLSMTAPMYIIFRAFRNNEYGYAAGVSVIFAVLIMAIIGIIRRGLRGEKIEY